MAKKFESKTDADLFAESAALKAQIADLRAKRKEIAEAIMGRARQRRAMKKSGGVTVTPDPGELTGE